MSYTFQEILDYSGFGYIPFEEKSDDVFLIDIPYQNTITLSFISTFVSDLSNNGFNVFTDITDSIAHIKAVQKAQKISEDEDYEEDDIELSERVITITATAYNTIKRWIKILNRRLNDLEVAVEKGVGLRDYTKRNKDTKKYERGRYGDTSTFYILNPEVNLDELKYIVDFIQGRAPSMPINPRWFTRANIFYVKDNEFLKSLGYSDNETYLQFPIDKDEINFDYSQNLGRDILKDTDISEENK